MVELLEKIENKTAKIGIIGLGYVGLPLALAFSEAEFNVLGFDNDHKKIEEINVKKRSYINHIKSKRLEKVVEEEKFFATLEINKISEVDVIILCLPTPLNEYREPDLSYVTNTMEDIMPFLKENQLLCFESTTYPGTTEEEIKTRVENKGFIVGDNFYLVYSPEREDPGNEKFNTSSVPKVVGGTTSNCLQLGVSLYGKVIDQIVSVSSTATAELTKLLENIYRAVNIGLVNEMKIVADKMNIDIWEVIKAASTKPFGFTPFYPGPGLGGHCIPIDPFYLTWKAREYGIHTKFIELAGEINTMMPEWVVQKLVLALNEDEKSVKNSKILVLGLAYKKNIDDTRESPSVKIMEILRDMGAEISYSDPYVPKFPRMRDYFFDLDSVIVNEDNLRKYDVIIISTDHDSFDYKLIQSKGKLIIDTRGRYKENYRNVIRA